MLPGADRGARARRRAARVTCPQRPGTTAALARHGLRAPSVRSLPRAAARRLRDRDGEDPALGGDEPGIVFVVGVACSSRSPSSSAKRATPAAESRRRAPAAAAARDGAPGAAVLRAAAAGRRRRSSCSALGWILQLLAVYVAMRAFDIDAPLAGGRARAAADERRDDLPPLAGQHRPAPGGRRAAARPVRRRLRDRVRLRDRAAGDRDVRRRRRRPPLPRARGTVVRDAAAGCPMRARTIRTKTTTRRRRSARRPLVRALACPASLKGVLTARRCRGGARGGAARGRCRRRRAAGRRRRRGNGGGAPAALGGEWREYDVHDAFGRPRRARWLVLPDGTAVVESAAAIPLDPLRLDPLQASSRGFGELVLAVLDDGPRRCCSRWADRDNGWGRRPARACSASSGCRRGLRAT